MKDSPNNQEGENQEVKSDIEMKKEQERERAILAEIRSMSHEEIMSDDIDIMDMFKDL